MKKKKENDCDIAKFLRRNWHSVKSCTYCVFDFFLFPKVPSSLGELHEIVKIFFSLSSAMIENQMVAKCLPFSFREL